MKNEKMIKNSKTIDTLLNVCEKIIFAGCIVLIVMMILIAVVGEEMVVNPNNFTLGNISVILKDTGETELSAIKGSLEMLMIPALIIIVVCWYGIRMFRKVLKPMKEGTPFEKSSSKNIRKLGVFVIIGGILINICNTIASALEYKLCRMNDVFNMDVISSINVNYDFDIAFIFVALVIFLLAHVFSYGEALQVESDETL